MKLGTAVVVTTEFRGVFFGYLKGKASNSLTLEKARNCIYWSSEVKGFMGLASTGPTKSCKIGPPVKNIELKKVTSVIQCDDPAISAWEAAPWSN
mgnify:CR=1 FL=1